MFQRANLIDINASKIKLFKSQANYWVMDCGSFVVDLANPAWAPASGLKTLAALMWGKKKKIEGKTTLITVASMISSVPNIVATVAKYLGMESIIIVNELSDEQVQNKLAIYPDCKEAQEKGALFIPALSTKSEDADALARQWIETHPDHTLISGGMHTNEIKRFNAALVNRLTSTPIDSIVAPVGSSFSLCSIINGMLTNGLTHPIYGVAVYARPLNLMFQELAKLEINVVVIENETYRLSKDDWHCTLTIIRDTEPLPHDQEEKYSRALMKDDVPLDPRFEAKCVPVLDKLIAEGHQPLLWNVSCSPTWAKKLRKECGVKNDLIPLNEKSF